jgi:hypothetical protein
MLSINKFNEIKRNIKFRFKCHYYGCLSHSEQLEDLEKEIYSKYPKSITNYERWYFKGMVELLQEQYYCNLEFCYRINGELYSTHKESNKKKIREIGYDMITSETENGFFYKHNNTKWSLDYNKLVPNGSMEKNYD